MMVRCGKRKNGKPLSVLMIQKLVCTSEADAKRVSKVHPQLKFAKRSVDSGSVAGRDGDGQ